MRKTHLTDYDGQGLHIYQQPGRRLEKVLKRLDLDLSADDPASRLDEDLRLKVIFRRCIEGNVFKIPAAFRFIPQPRPHGFFVAH